VNIINLLFEVGALFDPKTYLYYKKWGEDFKKY